MPGPSDKKLYSVHCGFYDADVSGGVYESHVNYFVAAESFEDARVRAKELPDFQARKMHVDGVQEIRSVSGYEVKLNESALLAGKTEVIAQPRRAPTT